VRDKSRIKYVRVAIKAQLFNKMKELYNKEEFHIILIFRSQYYI